MDRHQLIELSLALAAVALLTVGCLLVLRPFFSALMWAVILCYASWPLYQRLERGLGGRRTLAATVMTLLVTVVLLLPLLIVAWTLTSNLGGWLGAARRWLETELPDAPAWLAELPLIGPDLVQTWQELGTQGGLAREFQNWIPTLTEFALALGATLARGVVELALSLFIAFFVFRRGTELALGSKRVLTRLIGARARQFIQVAGSTIVGVVYGILGTALAQGSVALIGFLALGVPAAVLLALMTFFLSLIPMGPPLIWGGAALWLANEERYLAALIMALYGALVISSVDNVVRPYLISRGSDLPFVLVFMGVLGGILAFGFLGVFLGPVLLAVGYTLVLAWNRGASAVEPIDPGDAEPTHPEHA